MAFTEDKRHFHRIFYHAQAVFEGGGKRYPCELSDISLKGCLVTLAEPWTEPLEPFYTLSLTLTPEISITMEVSIAHVTGNHIGFRCEHIDIDSICNLRRLIELNLGDSDLLERELTALSDLGTPE